MMDETAGRGAAAGSGRPALAAPRLRLGYDASVLRHAARGGTVRYVEELLRALRATAGARSSVVALAGPLRWRTRASLLAWPRRIVNLSAELGWLTAGSLAAVAGRRLTAWLGPANTLPLVLPRPAVLTIHDVNFLSVPGSYRRSFTRYAEAAYRRSAHRAQRIVTDSDAARREIGARLGLDTARMTVIYPGIDHVGSIAPAAAAPGLPDRFALFVGQTEPHKNVGLLLDAWRAGVPDDLHLVIAGPAGRDDERLRRIAARTGLGPRVHFAGELDEPGLARLYVTARMFLFPSLSEGFGFPPLEAMARGIPTAVARAASLPEVTGDGALHFEPGDVDELVAIVARIDEDAELRGRLTSDGRRVAEGYRWADTATAMWEEVAHAIDG